MSKCYGILGWKSFRCWCAVGVLTAMVSAGCAHTPAPEPETTTAAQAETKPAAAAEPAGAAEPATESPPVEATVAGSAVQDTTIVDLVPDAEQVVRIGAVVVQTLQMRLVPPMIVFRVRDKSGGEVNVLLKEQKVLQEGTRLELVGKYHEVPSPSYSGPGEAPPELLFVVERYLVLP